MIFGREPKPTEMTAGVDYLAAEPLRAYEERKAADEAKKKEIAANPKKAPKPRRPPKDQPTMPMRRHDGGVTPRRPGAEPDRRSCCR